MKKLFGVGFLVFTLLISFSMAYADPLVYVNVRPTEIGTPNGDPAGSDLQTLLNPIGINVNTDQQAAGYWQLGGAYPGTLPSVAFEITANNATLQMGIFSDTNGSDDFAGRILVDIFLGDAAAGTRASIAFDPVTGAMTIGQASGPANAVNVGTFTGITASGFGFYIQPAGGDAPSALTWYSLDQLNNGGLAQMVAFREVDANRWTIGFEDVANPQGDHDFNDFIFQIESITPVPEPLSLILLGSGLLGLAGIRRKIKK